MEIKCPHCGVSYEVEKEEMYRYTTCGECGKGFVVGATSSLLSSDAQSASAIKAASAKPHASSASRINPVPRSRQVTGNSKLRSTRIPVQISHRQDKGMVLLKNGFWSFKGRARRKEYWSTVLILVVIALLFCVVPVVCFVSGLVESALVFAIVIYIVTFVAKLPVSVRRLHDVNLSGFWLLLNIVPYVGQVLPIAEFVILGCLDGTSGYNTYGPDPKGRQSAQTDRQQRQAQIPQAQNDDNIDEIGEYAANIEVNYVGVKGLTKEEKELFKIAVKTVTELSLYDN